MRIILHIGVEQTGADRLQRLLADRRADLAAQGVLYPKSPGNRNHTRLYMAATDPDHIDPLRFNRGHIAPEKQAALRDEVMAGLAAEVAEARPDLLILSAAQLCTLWRVSELERLRGMLAPLSDDIRVLAHVDGQARVLARHYATQVMEGRGSTLERELALAQAPDWWDACLAGMPAPDPAAGQFEETQAPPFWLDYTRLVAHWEGVFGTGSVTLCPHDEATFAGPQVMDALRAAFDLSGPLPEAVPGTAPAQPSAAWLARGRQFNALVLHLLSRHEKILPRQLWRSFLSEMEIGGVPIAPGALSPIADRFAEDNRALVKAHPALTAATFRKDRKRKLWAEADPERGFRASQYLLAFMFRIDKATRAERKAKKADLAALAAQPAPAAAAPVNGEASPDTRPAPTPTPEAPRKIEVARPAKAKAPDRQQVLSETGRALLPPLAVEKFEDLRTSPFAPHNRLGAVNEEELAAAYTPAPPARPARGQFGQCHRRLHEERGALHPGMGRLSPRHRRGQFPDLHQWVRGRHLRDSRPAARAGRAPAPQQRRLEGQLAPAIRPEPVAEGAGDPQRGMDHPYRRGRVHERALRQRHATRFLRTRAGCHQRGDDLAALWP